MAAETRNSPAIILSHSGKQHSYYTARALNNIGALKTFYTSSYITNPWLQRLILKRGLHFWSRRFLDGLSGPVVNAAWRYEIRELIYRRMFGNSEKVNELVLQRDRSFDNALSKLLRKTQYDLFWGFQGSCLESLRAANRAGKMSVCEMTTAHLPFAKKLLAEEQKLHPQWADSFDFAGFPHWYEDRLTNEPLEAGKVVAISSFLKHTLVSSGVDEKKIDVILLGFDADNIRYSEETKSIVNRPLKLLFAGKITQRKGVQYLLDATQSFSGSEVELTFIGNIYGPGQAFRSQSANHKHITGISQTELFRRYADFDILVFPSVLEGFGLVTVEAMGAGLPVITTPNTNAFEVLKDGHNGYLVPIRSSTAIAAAIRKFRNMDNQTFQQMRRNARATALKYTWEVYGQRVDEFVKSVANDL